MENSEFSHKSVLFDECMEGLSIKPDGIYIDCTLGRCGHSSGIASRLKDGRVIGIDRDGAAIDSAREKMAVYGDRFLAVRASFGSLNQVFLQLGLERADGILFDLGVSSPQLDDSARGFSYMKDAPLDMRMDLSQSLTARDIVNSRSVQELSRILRDFGEEKFSFQIARAIERRRAEKPIETTLELVDIIRSAMPAAALREKQHPAKRSFQAIRIAVNGELDELENGLRSAIELLKPGGRLAVITFHSLEDRPVKNIFREGSAGCTCPRDFPVCVCGKKPMLELITRKPILPSERELQENPRSRSAKLRIAERTVF